MEDMMVKGGLLAETASWVQGIKDLRLLIDNHDLDHFFHDRELIMITLFFLPTMIYKAIFRNLAWVMLG